MHASERYNKSTLYNFTCFNLLPIEIQERCLLSAIKRIKIDFKTLTQLTRVCKQFNQVMHGNYFFKQIFCNPSDLNQAINFNALPIVLKILKICPNIDPSNDDNEAIRLASEKGHVEIVKALMQDKRVDPSTHNNELIIKASKKGHVEFVKILLQDERVDPSADNNVAFKWASEKGHIEVVKALLQDERVDPSANANAALKWANKNGHVEVINALQNRRISPSNNDKKTPGLKNWVIRKFLK